VTNYSAESLYSLLPAVYRRRDLALGLPLRDLVMILAEQAEIVEQDIARLYENQFIETCESWVAPYIGDLIGVRGNSPTGVSRRAEVANTIGYRRRKGTAANLEQLAHDIFAKPARVVEFFELLATTQYLNHIRWHNLRTPDIRDANAMELLDGPFDTAAHTVDVRRIAIRRGRHNIPNIGLFLWRLTAYPLRDITPSLVDDATGRHFTLNVLGLDEPLFNHPVTETSAAQIAGELNVPGVIRRRALNHDPASYYGSGLSLEIETDDGPVPVDKILPCDLSDFARPLPAGRVAVDPKSGRLAFPADEAPPAGVRATYYYGFSDDLGGGQYDRLDSFVEFSADTLFSVGLDGVGASTINEALDQWGGVGSAIIEITDSRTYREDIDRAIPADSRLEIRAANKTRPTLVLNTPLRITGAENSSFTLNGLLISDRPVQVSGNVNQVRLLHCTLAPGSSRHADSTPAPSLVVDALEPDVTIEQSILGEVRASVDSQFRISDSILDVAGRETSAYAGPGGAGGTLVVVRCTIRGAVHTREMSLGENSLFLDPVIAERRQQGCMRFSFVAPGSRTPRRYRCQPGIPEGAADLAGLTARLTPRFTSMTYGDPGYFQLIRGNPDEIRKGTEDGSEMGVFSRLRLPQREDYLRLRLDEYLRLGLEAGIYFAN
jgi:hypothetical protein